MWRKPAERGPILYSDGKWRHKSQDGVREVEFWLHESGFFFMFLDDNEVGTSELVAHELDWANFVSEGFVREGHPFLVKWNIPFNPPDTLYPFTASKPRGGLRP